MLKWCRVLVGLIAVVWIVRLAGMAGDLELSKKPMVWACAVALVPQLLLLKRVRRAG